MSVTISTMTPADPTGVLGLLPDDVGIRALLRFEETEDTIAPAEDLGALSAVRPAAAAVFPEIVDGYTSRARDFDGLSGIQATDADGLALLVRTVSVVAIVEWDHAATSGPDTIAAHGVGGSVVERRSWQLRLSKPSPGIGRVQWIWQDRSGAEHAQAGADFFLPASGYMLVAATREWSGERFELRYWVGETLLGEGESDDLEVGGGIGSTVTLGCVGDGAGGFLEFFHGRIDQVAIFSEALTQAQVSHLWQRIAVWPADVYAAVRDLQPPGDARSRSPQSLVQRCFRVQSGLLAATATMVLLRADAGLPDRAFGPRLVLWERATGQVARPGESIARRRARVLAALLGEQGLSADAIKDNLAPLLGLEPEELELVRYDNVTRGIDPAAWREQGDGTVLVDFPNDEITLRVPAAAQYSTLLGGYSYRTAVKDEPTITATIEATTLSNDDVFVGLSTHSGTLPGAGGTLAGVKLDTSALQLVNTLTGSNIQAYTLPVSVRVYRDGVNIKARINGGVEVALGATSAKLGYAQVGLVPISGSVPGSARSARLSDVRVQQHDSRSPQCAYVYVESAADIVGARRQLQHQQPAHAHCAVLVGRRAVRCDDALHGASSAPAPETQRDYILTWLGRTLARAWAGVPVDLVSGEVLTAAGAATYNADTRSYGPFGDQALTFAAGLVDKWTLPSISSLQFSDTAYTAFLMVFDISSFSLGTSYTLIGNRAGADLQGFEVAIDASGNLVVRFDGGAAAPVELTFQPCHTLPGWRGLAIRHDHVTDTVTAATEIQVQTASFSSNAASSIATALGAYRALQTPTWRCGLLTVDEGDAAQFFDPTAAAVYAHRSWANLFDHPAELPALPLGPQPGRHVVGLHD